MLAEPYQSLNLLPFNDHGWFSDANRRQLERLIREHAVRDVIEVGSWLGKSARHIAKLLTPPGRLWCVDLWSDLPFCRGNMQLAGVSRLYQQFLSNAIHAEVADRITPIRLPSLEAAASFHFSANLIYIDGDHSAAGVYADVMAWSAHLRPGGILCGDDWKIPKFEVEAGVRRALEELGRTVEADGPFWWSLPS